MLDYFDSQTSKFLLITILAGMVFFGLIFYFLKKLGKSPKNILPVNFAGNMRLPLALFMLALVLKIIKTNDRILEFIEENFLSHVSTLLLDKNHQLFSYVYPKVPGSRGVNGAH